MRLAVLLAIIPLFLAGCAAEDNVVEITSSGFSPATLAVKAGQTVTFVNVDDEPHWPASAIHPTHGEYPEEGGCIGSRFDACGPLGKGGKFSFTFRHKGEWEYHDHLNSGMKGRIIVE